MLFVSVHQMPQKRTFWVLKGCFIAAVLKTIFTSHKHNRFCFCKYGQYIFSPFWEGKKWNFDQECVEKWIPTKMHGRRHKYLSWLIIHMGIHIVQLCMCVIIYLDLENKSCCLVRRCLSVNFDGKYFILSIVCALALWADSCDLLIFNRFPCKHEDQLIAVSLTSREKKAMGKKLP